MNILKKNLHIAIDGPVGAGKSIGAYKLAKKLGILYVYTGAMYRTVAWLALKYNLDLNDEEGILSLLRRSKIVLQKPSRSNRVCDILIDGQDITAELFSTQIHKTVAMVSALPKIREHLVKIQKDLAQDQAVVMEGRDVTNIVLPKADLKIYMTASFEERLSRRYKDLLARGEQITLAEVASDIRKRDYDDIHRKTSPLIKTQDSWELDTTNLSKEEEVEMIISKLKLLKLVA